MLGQKSLFCGRACEESYSFYPPYFSRSGAFGSGCCPYRQFLARGAEALAEVVQKEHEATEESAEEGDEIAKKGDERLEEESPDKPLIRSLDAGPRASHEAVARLSYGKIRNTKVAAPRVPQQGCRCMVDVRGSVCWKSLEQSA